MKENDHDNTKKEKKMKELIINGFQIMRPLRWLEKGLSN